MTPEKRKAKAKELRDAWRGFEKELPGERVAYVKRMQFTFRLCVGDIYDDTSYDDGWCYESEVLAMAAAMLWDGVGDPLDGWVKHLRSRRRRPHGDASKEFVAP